MGIGLAQDGAAKLVEELYERMLGVGHNLVARDELPRDAEEFAQTVVHVVFDALAGGMLLLNQGTGLHPDDPRRDAPEQPSPGR
jgi:hypothetical protein